MDSLGELIRAEWKERKNGSVLLLVLVLLLLLPLAGLVSVLFHNFGQEPNEVLGVGMLMQGFLPSLSVAGVLLGSELVASRTQGRRLAFERRVPMAETLLFTSKLVYLFLVISGIAMVAKLIGIDGAFSAVPTALAAGLFAMTISSWLPTASFAFVATLLFLCLLCTGWLMALSVNPWYVPNDFVLWSFLVFVFPLFGYATAWVSLRAYRYGGGGGGAAVRGIPLALALVALTSGVAWSQREAWSSPQLGAPSTVIGRAELMNGRMLYLELHRYRVLDTAGQPTRAFPILLDLKRRTWKEVAKRNAKPIKNADGIFIVDSKYAHVGEDNKTRIASGRAEKTARILGFVDEDHFLLLRGETLRSMRRYSFIEDESPSWVFHKCYWRKVAAR